MTLLIQRRARFPSHHLYSAVKVPIVAPAAPRGRTLTTSLWEVALLFSVMCNHIYSTVSFMVFVCGCV